MHRPYSLWLGGVAALALFSTSAPAQIFFSAGSPYNQDFNSLASSGAANTWTDNATLPGWYASKTLGGSAVTAYRADTGTSTAGALYSYGASADGERALGSLGSGTPGNFAYGVRFANDTTEAITNITFSYTGEQWRNGGNVTPQTLAFAHQISTVPFSSSDAANATAWTAVNELSFTSPVALASPGALDGNAAANRQTFAGVLLRDVVVFPGEEIFFRWLDINDTGNDHGLAIDDLTISFTTVTPFTNPPAISVDPQSATNNAGTIAAFTVTATGSSLTYQWRKQGVDIADDGFKLAGCLTRTVTISNAVAFDAGEYSVVIANGAGSVTSRVAVLTVIDPAISTPPVSRTAVAGDNAAFSVTAAGTFPLSYQWRFKGADLADATASRLSLPAVQPENQGGYNVVVSNALGNSITSAVAVLTVLSPANLLAQWDFNDTNTLAADGPVATLGAGAAAVVATKGTFAGGSPSDPAGAPGSANSGWNTTGYASQGTSNKLTGAQFNLSTVGYQDLLLTWEERHSNTASKYVRLQYSTDGINFSDGPVLTMTATDNSFVFYSANLAGIATLNNNPSFAFRFVSEFESTALGTTNNNYVATAGSYGAGGTIRLDLVRVFASPAGTVSPIPLNFQRLGSDLVLTWSNPAFSLASSSDPALPFTKITGATSPYTNTPTGTATFFRLVYP